MYSGKVCSSCLVWQNLQSCRYLCIGQADVSQPSRNLARPAHGTRLVMGELPGTCPVDAIEI